MTLRELLETTLGLGELIIDIRNAKSTLVDSVHIGTYVREDKVLSVNLLPRWKVINKPLDWKEIGKDYWGTILKNIPKKLLDMQVTYWKIHGTAFSTNNNLNKFETLYVCVVGEDVCVIDEPKKEIEGQMQIEGIVNKCLG